MKTKFIGKIMWGSCSELPAEGGSLSEAVMIANELDRDAMKEMLEKFIGCSFFPNNLLNDTSDIISNTDEVKIETIKVLELDYSDGEYNDSLPTVLAEVRFTLDTPRKLSQRLLKIWEHENKEDIFSGLSFYWKDDDDEIYFDGDKGISLEVDEQK